MWGALLQRQALALGALFAAHRAARWALWRIKLARALRSDGHGRTAVVTGGASGVGRATVLLLAERGWRVYALDVNAGALQTLSEAAAAQKLDVRARNVDITDEAAQDKLRDEVLGELPDKEAGLDALVNCAGVTFQTPVLGVPPAQQELQLKVNLLAPMRLTRIFHRSLCAGARGGAVVNVSSISGSVAWPWQGAYAVTKFGLNGFTDVLRREAAACKLKLRVVSVEPGPINTPLVDGFVKRTGIWARENPTDLFLSGVQRVESAGAITTDMRNHGAVFLSARQVAEAILVGASDMSPGARQVLLPWGFAPIIWLVQTLPERWGDAVMLKL